MERCSYTFLTANFAGYFRIAAICERKGLLFRRRYKNGTLKPYRVTVYGTRNEIEKVVKDLKGAS